MDLSTTDHASMNRYCRSMSGRTFNSLRLAAAPALMVSVITGCSGGGGSGGQSPVAVADSYTSAIGQTTITVTSPGVLANDTGSALTAEIVDPPTNHSGTFTLNANGSFTYTLRSTAAATTDSFTYRARNGTAVSGVATVTINITPPEAVADTFSMNAPGGTVSGNVLANDNPASGLTAELMTGPSRQGSFTLNPDGSFSYTHNNDGAISDSFTYRAKVGAIASNTVTVTININQPPVARNVCPSIGDNETSLDINPGPFVLGSDPNGTAPTYEVVTPPVNGTATPNAQGGFTYVPNFNASGRRGMDKFSFRAVDASNPGLVSPPATVTILNNGKVRIMPLGDSITQGTGDPGGAGYRRRLFQELELLTGTGRIDFVGSQTAGPSDFDRDHEGHGGWCDDNNPCGGGAYGNIKDNVQTFLTSKPADIILLHIGTNDFQLDPTGSGIGGILGNVNTWAQSNYPLTVFVARIIPSVNGSLDVNSFNNNVNTAISNNKSNWPKLTIPTMVNQQGELQKPGVPNEADPSLMDDNLHPNPDGYNKMALRWKSDMVASGVLPTCP